VYFSGKLTHNTHTTDPTHPATQHLPVPHNTFHKVIEKSAVLYIAPWELRLSVFALSTMNQSKPARAHPPAGPGAPRMMPRMSTLGVCTARRIGWWLRCTLAICSFPLWRCAGDGWRCAGDALAMLWRCAGDALAALARGSSPLCLKQRLI
jgi:hypothetical protein